MFECPKTVSSASCSCCSVREPSPWAGNAGSSTAMGARARSRRSGRFGRGDVLRSRLLVTGDSVAASDPAQPLPICGRIARSGRGGRGRTGDLGPCRPGPMPAEPPRGSVNVRIAHGKGSPEGNRRRTGPGQRPKGTNRRTPDEGKPEEGGRRGKNPAGKRETGGKPAGETGGREVRPQTTR
jgi:hypothetical protein